MAVFSLPNDAPWSDIAWNGSVYCAIESFPIGVVATSQDGETWAVTAMVAPSSGTWDRIIWSGTVFLAVGQSTRDTATSPDGLVWTLHTNAFPDLVGAVDVVWSGSQFCAVRSGASAVALSSNGVNWTAAYALPIEGTRIAWNGSVFCVTMTYGSSVAVSVAGTSWATHALPEAIIIRDITNAGSVFCAVGSNAAETIAISAISEDGGETWTANNVAASSRFLSVARSESAFFVIGDDGSYVALAAISPDGVSWELDHTVAADNWRALIYDGVRFCAIGDVQVPSYSQIFATFVSEYVAPLFWTNLKGQSEANA